jgi:hypothetical protein
VNPGVQLMYLDGSRMIHEQALAEGVQSNFYTFYGANHTPYLGTSASALAYMDTTINFVRDYLIDRLGCSDAILQAANPPVETATLYAFSPCSGNQPVDWCTGAGIKDVEELIALKVFPNPSNQNVQIEWFGDTHLDLEMYDYSGRKVYSQPSISSNYVFEHGNLDNGVYILKLKEENGNILTRVLILN